MDKKKTFIILGDVSPQMLAEMKETNVVLKEVRELLKQQVTSNCLKIICHAQMLNNKMCSTHSQLLIRIDIIITNMF